MERPARDSSEIFFGADSYSVDCEETPASSDSWSSGVHTPTSSDDDPAQPGGAPVQQHMPADESPYLEYEYPDPFETTSAWRTADSNSEAASSTLASSRDWVGDQEHREAQGADVVLLTLDSGWTRSDILNSMTLFSMFSCARQNACSAERHRQMPGINISLIVGGKLEHCTVCSRLPRTSSYVTRSEIRFYIPWRAILDCQICRRKPRVMKFYGGSSILGQTVSARQ